MHIFIQIYIHVYKYTYQHIPHEHSVIDIFDSFLVGMVPLSHSEGRMDLRVGTMALNRTVGQCSQDAFLR